VACAGFQGVPFLHWRFRVRNVHTGRMTLLGGWISRLGMTNLPQLFNLVRGEMGLFGPAPVRLAFSEYLDREAPIHAYRFSIKPGIFGWSQTNTGYPWVKESAMDGVGVPDEQLQMSYDLYYLEHGSLFIDIESLLGSLGNILGLGALGRGRRTLATPEKSAGKNP
jgi:lipopolysaccharide/colanic/teichoic acid biosynthesis glycosyltransferase